MKTKFNQILLMSLIFVLVWSVSVFAVSEALVDPDIPESWYEAPKTASELGITEFNESPMLAEKVANGELPPVAERLPDDPITIEPYDEIGKYGGTIVLYGVDFSTRDIGLMLEYKGDAPFRLTPTGDEVIPWLAESYKHSEDKTKLTMKFREGIKWSDGTAFNAAEEYAFFWKNYIQNEELSQGYEPTLVEDITTEGKNTVIMHYNKPNPHEYPNTLGFQGFSVAPSHILKQYNPQIVGKEKAEQRAKELGFSGLAEAYQELSNEALAPRYPEYNVPTIKPYKVVKRTETEMVFERNPYYPFVDTAGNQLPYIDRIIVYSATNSEIAGIKAITGESTIAQSSLVPENIPLYKNNEEKGNYRTLIYTSPSPAFPYYMCNLNDDEHEFAEIFRDKRFRYALSLGINREELNQKFFFGYGVPMQASAPPSTKYFKEEYGEAYSNYDPEEAKRLLDEMGMIDVDGDGFRETPAGNKFVPKLLLRSDNKAKFGTHSFHELVTAYWKEIGINTEMELVGGGMYWNKRNDVTWDITSHPLDSVMPYIGTGGLDKFLAPVSGNASGPWIKWSRWFDTDGEEGVKPEDDIYFELVELANKWVSDADEIALDKLLQYQAENLWVIGTVAQPPIPVIVSNRIKNVPEKGLIDFSLGQFDIARPVQFYFDE